MLKHKSLVMVSVLVIVLAVVAMSCAPAKPPAPPPAPPAPPVVAPPVVTPPVVTEPVVTPPVVAPVVEKPTSFESATYTDDANGFSFRYPKSLKVAAKPYATGVFYANDGSVPLPTDLVFVDVRPATSVKDAAVAALGDFVAAKGASAEVKVDSETAVTLADGKTAATEIALSASVLFMKKVGSCLGVLKDGKAITVLAGIDPKNAALYKEICSTLVIK